MLSLSSLIQEALDEGMDVKIIVSQNKDDEGGGTIQIPVAWINRLVENVDEATAHLLVLRGTERKR